ncbi:MAG: DUF547 domain-containing protein [Comamonadaceae bacterium]|nr:DUF547 domain-containing protein [Comamonadaceae bacterium]
MKPSQVRRRTLLALLGGSMFVHGAWAQAAFDHGFTAWNSLLKKHVRWLPDGTASQVDYRGFAADRTALKAVLDGMSALPRASFDAWTPAQQMAFLINAYNAFTVELILTKYPDLKSIKDLGSLLRSPWKQKFFNLLGEPRHLDWIEHEQLRPRYAEPRIHAAVNCASIGCPALRDEAFTATTLEAQLEDGMRRFMSDRSRNRVTNGRLEVSAIFKWFREDFEKGHLGLNRVEDLFARYAAQLSDAPEVQASLRQRALPVHHLEYDWALNALSH